MGEIDPKSGGGERREATEDDNNNGHRHPILLMSNPEIGSAKRRRPPRRGDNDETHDARGGRPIGAGQPRAGGRSIRSTPSFEGGSDRITLLLGFERLFDPVAL
jgi:hypothetical protein